MPGLYGSIALFTFAYRHPTVQHLIETSSASAVDRRDVRNISDLWQLMHQNAYRRCGLYRQQCHLRDGGPVDIKGKMANMPVYDLFGYKMRLRSVYRHGRCQCGRDLREHREVPFHRCQAHPRARYGGGGFGPVRSKVTSRAGRVSGQQEVCATPFSCSTASVPRKA